MHCTESFADVTQLRKSEPAASPYLSVYSFVYEIRAWEPKSLSAVRINPNGENVNETLKIDMGQGIIQKTWKDKPKSDGYFQPNEQLFEMRTKNVYETPFAD
ncbi:hypothetical protein GCM10011396_10260 [Undibacterium terreum]|uniref:Uncharacterized protein n=2 Tax=Undibacterium terreum TaxID=1224302 RepID=A0A916UB22_9BURK|nr:hypothetical protein GCM10011396_10260 [Undibacterium terreum]